MGMSVQGAFPISDPDAGQARAVLFQYRDPWDAPEAFLTPIAAGFSGGRVWKVRVDGSLAALRRWPHGYRETRLCAIHEILLEANGAGCGFVPVPVSNRRGATTLVEGGHLWDLSTWMPGEPAPAASCDEGRVRAALGCLRQWHDFGRQRASRLDVSELTDRATALAFRQKQPSPSPGLLRRCREWKRLFPRAPFPVESPDPCHLARRTFQAATRAARRMDHLESMAREAVPLTVCWNDPHRDNVLFVGNSVGGLIDYGSVAVDCPAADLGRLLGSFLPKDRSRWTELLDAYDIAAETRRWALHAWLFHHTGMVIAALHWWEWHGRWGRTFADPPAAYERWRRVVETLEGSFSPTEIFSE